MASKSIRYFTRERILDDSKPLTVLELRNFLDRLVMGGYGDFKMLTPTTNYTLNDRNNTVILD